MSKILNIYKFTDSCGEYTDFFDLAPGKEPDNVVITCNQNIAIVTKVIV